MAILLNFGAAVHLRNQGFEVDKCCWCPQSIPCQHVRSLASKILECGPSCWRSIACQHPNGEARLHLAAPDKKSAVMSLRLDKGADLPMINAKGYTALYFALVKSKGVFATHYWPSWGNHANHVFCRVEFAKAVRHLRIRGGYPYVTDCEPACITHAFGTVEEQEEGTCK